MKPAVVHCVVCTLCSKMYNSYSQEKNYRGVVLYSSTQAQNPGTVQ